MVIVTFSNKLGHQDVVMGVFDNREEAQKSIQEYKSSDLGLEIKAVLEFHPNILYVL